MQRRKIRQIYCHIVHKDHKLMYICYMGRIEAVAEWATGLPAGGSHWKLHKEGPIFAEKGPLLQNCNLVPHPSLLRIHPLVLPWVYNGRWRILSQSATLLLHVWKYTDQVPIQRKSDLNSLLIYSMTFDKYKFLYHFHKTFNSWKCLNYSLWKRK